MNDIPSPYQFSKYHFPPQMNPREFLRKQEFEFTKHSRDEKRYKRNKCLFKFASLCYFAILGVIFWHVKEAENYVYYAMILGLNFVLLFLLGTFTIRTVVFPFSLWIVRDLLLGNNCIHYGKEFTKLVQKTYTLMRTTLAEKSDNPYERSEYL